MTFSLSFSQLGQEPGETAFWSFSPKRGKSKNLEVSLPHPHLVHRGNRFLGQRTGWGPWRELCLGGLTLSNVPMRGGVAMEGPGFTLQEVLVVLTASWDTVSPCPKWHPPYGPWSKVVHCVGNRVPFGTFPIICILTLQGMRESVREYMNVNSWNVFPCPSILCLSSLDSIPINRTGYFQVKGFAQGYTGSRTTISICQQHSAHVSITFHIYYSVQTFD